MIYLGIYKNSSVLKFGMSKNAYKRQYVIRKEKVEHVSNPASFELLKVWDTENQYNKAESLFIESYIRMALNKLGYKEFGNDHFYATRKVVTLVEKLYYEAIVMIEKY